MSNQSLNQEVLHQTLKREQFSYFQECYYYDTVESTNTIGRELITSGINHGTIIVAGTQTKGRGRYTRTWYSPLSGLYLSLLFQPIIPQKQLSLFPLLTANTIHLLLKHLTINSTIKWPNDVLVNSKKIAGILIEATTDLKQNNYIICGIGINVNNHLETFPDALHTPATSIINEINHETNLIDIIIRFIHIFEKQYNKLLEKNTKEIIDQWKTASGTLGKQVTIKQKNETIHGIAEDIDEDGFLLIRTPTNKIERITSGDCIY